MLNTYLNDNQHRPYPFYGGTTLPFPNCCVTGLGVCLQKDDLADKPIFASVVVISKNSVRVALCRDTKTGSAAEFVGMIYATSNYYTYIASSSNSNVYETNLITDPVDLDRLVYYDVSGEDAISSLQVFYSFVESVEEGITRSYVKSTGYMQIGTIPEDAIGVYTGKFYLDPSCVTYMPKVVLGYHTDITVNHNHQEIGHSLVFSASGLLTLSVTGGTTLTFGCLESTDKSILTEAPTRGYDFVTYIYGMTVPVGGVLDIRTADSAAGKINIAGTTTKSGDVLVTLDGTTLFPNCFIGGLTNA